MLPSSKKFLELTNNNSPDVAVILGSGLTNFFEEKDIIKSSMSTTKRVATLWLALYYISELTYTRD